MSRDAGKRSTSRPGPEPGEGSAQNTEHNLLFGVLALELDLIDASQFAEACATWAVRKDVPLAEILRERRWLDEEGRADVEKLLARRLRKHHGDVCQSLAAAADAPIRELISDVEDARVRETIKELPPALRGAYVQVETLELKRETRSHYTLTRVHGQGGLGRVWLARDMRLNREVALKEILPKRDEDPVAQRRLVREAQVTGQLEHPNIVPVYELSRGEEEESTFYVMRYVRGQTLRAAIKEHHRMRQEGAEDPIGLCRLLQSFIDVCNAVGYAHAHGVIHRDLKPANVMLGPFGEVTVLDWGLAKLVTQPAEQSDETAVMLPPTGEADLTMPGQALGTLGYMAPEQADPHGSVVDSRTDVYGLGAILFEILTCVPPHRGTREEDLRSRIVHSPTPRARVEERSVPAALDAICAKAMAKKRSKRYRSAGDLADDVQRWLADEPVSVYSEPWSHRLFRWLRRHRAWTLPTAAALLIVTLMSIIAFLAVDHARREEKLAKLEAVRRFEESLDTVDAMLTGVSEVLHYYPGTQTLRTRLLERAADDYLRFSAEDSTDPQISAESGRALIRLGDVYRWLGRHNEAIDALRRGSERLDRLAAGSPNRAELELESIECLTRLAEVQTGVGDHPQAERTFIEAETRLQTSVDSARSRLARARLQVSFALLKDDASQTVEAIELLEKAERTYSQLAASEKESRSTYQEGLALARSIRGQILVGAGRQQQAVEPIEEAIQAYQELAEENLDEPRYLEGLAFSRINLANALRSLGDSNREMAALEEAIFDLEALLGAMPDVPNFSENLAASHAALGRLYHHLGQNPLARDHLDLALERFERLANSDSPLPRHYEKLAIACTLYGQILRDLGDPFAEVNYETAKQLYAGLLKEYPDTADYWRGLGVCQRHFARVLHGAERLQEAQQEYDQARGSLEEALKLLRGDPFALDALAWCWEHQGDLRSEKGEDPQQDYAAARKIREGLRATPEDEYRLAMVSLKLGDTGQATELAAGLTRSVPENPNYWTLAGAAEYRAGDFAASVDALEQHEPAAGDGSRQFWLSMALWARAREGDKQRARDTFRTGTERMEQNAPARIEVIQLREEAASILGLGTGGEPEREPAPKSSPEDTQNR
jgi:serine/threonine-protein kinase